MIAGHTLAQWEEIGFITSRKAEGKAFQEKAGQGRSKVLVRMVSSQTPHSLLDELECLLGMESMGIIGLQLDALEDLRRWIALAYLARRRGKRLVLLSDGLEESAANGIGVDIFTWQNAMIEQGAHLVEDFDGLIDLCMVLAAWNGHPPRGGEIGVLTLAQGKASLTCLRIDGRDLTLGQTAGNPSVADNLLLGDWEKIRRALSPDGNHSPVGLLLCQMENGLKDKSQIQGLVRLKNQLGIPFLVQTGAKERNGKGEGALWREGIPVVSRSRTVQRLLRIMANQREASRSRTPWLREWGFTCIPGFQDKLTQ